MDVNCTHTKTTHTTVFMIYFFYSDYSYSFNDKMLLKCNICDENSIVLIKFDEKIPNLQDL